MIPLHVGMSFVFKKGRIKGRKGTIIKLAGTRVLIATSKCNYWTNKSNLGKRVKWL